MNLTPLETADLERLETAIQKHQQAFVECGLAIAEIRDRRLYRKDFESFEAYCLSRWGWSRQRAQQLERAAKLVEALPEKSAVLVPDEKSARTLADIPANQRAPLLQKMARSGERITPDSIAQSRSILSKGPETLKNGFSKEPKTGCSISKKADSIEPNVSTQVDKPKNAEEKKQDVIRDVIGFPIPDECLPYWNRRQEIQDLLTGISKAKCAVQKAKDADDPLFGRCGKAAIADLTQAYTHVSEAKPFAVCTECNGHPKLNKGCNHCCGTGLISEWRWNTSARKEIKEIRLRAIAAERSK